MNKILIDTNIYSNAMRGNTNEVAASRTARAAMLESRAVMLLG